MRTAPSQQDLFATSAAVDDVIGRLRIALPDLPPVIRYHDEFDDKLRSIRNPVDQSIFELSINGRRINIDFSRFEECCAFIFKHIFISILGQDASIATTAGYLLSAHHLTTEDVSGIVGAGPTGIGAIWTTLRARSLPRSTYNFAKCIIHLLCEHRLHGWSNDYGAYVSTALPLPALDKYAGVHSGDVFLSADEEALIVRHLDYTVEQLSEPDRSQYPHTEIADAGMLLCAYQFAMRPIQIAMLGVRNVRIWNDEDTGWPTVHLTFHTAKQREQAKRSPLTRRVKAEWAPIFVALKARVRDGGAGSSARFFPVESNHEAGSRIATLVRKLLGSEDIGTATDLRHTAAQRLVDAGANHEELAEFLGHAQTNTGLVYYATSASHAQRINGSLLKVA